MLSHSRLSSAQISGYAHKESVGSVCLLSTNVINITSPFLCFTLSHQEVKLAKAYYWFISLITSLFYIGREMVILFMGIVLKVLFPRGVRTFTSYWEQPRFSGGQFHFTFLSI